MLTLWEAPSWHERRATIIYSGDPDYRASTLTPPKLTQKALRSLARPTVAGQ